MVSTQPSDGDFSQPAFKLNGSSQPTLAADALDEVHVFWLAGMSCDGCSVSTVGASAPSVEALLTGNMPGLPKIVLHHPVLSVEAGDEFMHPFHLAMQGKLGKQFVVVYEGSIPDERQNDENGGYWVALGKHEVDGEEQPFPTADIMALMAPYAAAVIAIGTCATWGGIPAAAGNVTGSMGLMDFLGEDYRSTFGLPVVNIPGCAPQGDNFTETVAAVLMFLQGIGPLPEFDSLGRPAWLFTDTVHQTCTRGGFYEEGIFAKNFGDKQCLVEIGCWGPVVQCNINKRGAINHVGGCMNVGAPCIGCTMPGFPDNFSPFYTKPPGTIVSSTVSKSIGYFIRNLRRFSMMYANRTMLWNKNNHVPSGWGHVEEASALQKVTHYFYSKIQFHKSVRPGSKPKNQKSSGKAMEEVKQQ